MQTSPLHLTIPLSTTAHDWAQQFAVEQTSPLKRKQVYLNTLAVWAVHRYLSWLQIATNLEQGNSWNPGVRALFDVADLVLPGLGALECRPVLPGETAIALPPEVQGDFPLHTAHPYLGYVAVQFQDTLQEATLLGFVPAAIATADTTELSLSKLQSLDVLLEQLTLLEPAISPQNSPLTHLSQWLQASFESGWQTIDEILGNQTPALVFRQSTVRRAKQIQWGDRTSPLALILTLTPEAANQLGIHVQIISTGKGSLNLPSALCLRILTATGQLFKEILAEATDTFIQYEFTADLEERFSIELTLNNERFAETFVA